MSPVRSRWWRRWSPGPDSVSSSGPAPRSFSSSPDCSERSRRCSFRSGRRASPSRSLQSRCWPRRRCNGRSTGRRTHRSPRPGRTVCGDDHGDADRRSRRRAIQRERPRPRHPHRRALRRSAHRARHRRWRHRRQAALARVGRLRWRCRAGSSPSAATTSVSDGGTPLASFDAVELRAFEPARSPLHRTANYLRARVLAGSRHLAPTERALMAGFLLGDTRELPRDVEEQFRASGLTHLLAVSGANVAFVLALARPVLRRLPLRAQLVAGLTLLVVFGTMTRWEPSVLRACAMAACSMTALYLGRPTAGLRVRARGRRARPRRSVPPALGRLPALVRRERRHRRARAPRSRPASPGRAGSARRWASPPPRRSASRPCSSRCSARCRSSRSPANLVAVPFAAPLTVLGARGRRRRRRGPSRASPGLVAAAGPTAVLARAMLCGGGVLRRGFRSPSTAVPRGRSRRARRSWAAARKLCVADDAVASECDALYRLGDDVHDLTDRTLVMGILNRTPDSFYDRGRDLRARRAPPPGRGARRRGRRPPRRRRREGRARARGRRGRGARPRRRRRSRRSTRASTCRSRVDTWRASVLDAACEAGAVVGNDISGFADPDYLAVAAKHGASVVATHIRLAPRVRRPEPALRRPRRRRHRLPARPRRAGRSRRPRRPSRSRSMPASTSARRRRRAPCSCARATRSPRTGTRCCCRRRTSASSVSCSTSTSTTDARASLAAVAYGVAHGCRIVRVHDVAGSVQVCRMVEALRARAETERGVMSASSQVKGHRSDVARPTWSTTSSTSSSAATTARSHSRSSRCRAGRQPARRRATPRRADGARGGRRRRAERGESPPFMTARRVVVLNEVGNLGPGDVAPLVAYLDDR